MAASDTNSAVDRTLDRINNLPDELLLLTFSRLALTWHEMHDRLKLLWICRRWRALAVDIALWPLHPPWKLGISDCYPLSMVACLAAASQRAPGEELNVAQHVRTPNLRIIVEDSMPDYLTTVNVVPFTHELVFGANMVDPANWVVHFAGNRVKSLEYKGLLDDEELTQLVCDTFTGLTSLIATASIRSQAPRIVFQSALPLVSLTINLYGDATLFTHAGPVPPAVDSRGQARYPIQLTLQQLSVRGGLFSEHHAGFLSRHRFPNLREINIPVTAPFHFPGILTTEPPVGLTHLACPAGLNATRALNIPSLTSLEVNHQSSSMYGATALAPVDLNAYPYLRRLAIRGPPPGQASLNFLRLFQIDRLLDWIPEFLTTCPADHPLREIRFGIFKREATPYAAMVEPLEKAPHQVVKVGSGWRLTVTAWLESHEYAEFVLSRE